MLLSIETIKQLIQNLGSGFPTTIGDPIFKDPHIRSNPLNSSSIRIIGNSKSNKKLAFVDGGNQELLGAPNFSIQFNRIYSSIWEKNHKLHNDLPRVEYYSSTIANYSHGDISYNTDLFCSNDSFSKFLPSKTHLAINSSDRSIQASNGLRSIYRAASISRRFSEKILAHSIIDQLTRGDILVLDGTLKVGYPNEDKYLDRLKTEAKSKGILLTGLSKSSTLLTTTGLSLFGALNTLSKKSNMNGPWYIELAESIHKSHDAQIFGVKLNDISDRIFRFEIDRDQFSMLEENEILEIFSIIADNSVDPSFPGYPYGLIDADRFARVPYKEIDYHRNMLMSQIHESKELENFVEHIYSVDTHDRINDIIG